MSVLITGAAGFIGYHVSEALLAAGETVVGVDVINDYYDVALKNARLDRLRRHDQFDFHKLDVADRKNMKALAVAHPDVDRVVHLAAQAGIRYSLINPYAYTRSNIEGQMVILEMCREMTGLKHLIYASSSSVYGGNQKMPFSIDDRTDHPHSLYAATKRSGELMAEAYAHLFSLSMTGLRFFTVYGPWGRPDMAAFIFTRKILRGEPIQVFNHGDMRRDFTYIDDVTKGIVSCLGHPPTAGGDQSSHAIYNLGNHRSEKLTDLIEVIENALGEKAIIEFEPMQAVDVKDTYADITATRAAFEYDPSTNIQDGIPKFIEWYREFYEV